jgi:lipid-A-disaccharide synthase
VKYITLVNLLATDDLFPQDLTPYDPLQADADRVLFPEYLTWQDKSEQIAQHVIQWLTEPEKRQASIEALAALRAQVAGEGASSRAADYILGVLAAPLAPVPQPHFALSGEPVPFRS